MHVWFCIYGGHCVFQRSLAGVISIIPWPFYAIKTLHHMHNFTCKDQLSRGGKCGLCYPYWPAGELFKLHVGQQHNCRSERMLGPRSWVRRLLGEEIPVLHRGRLAKDALSQHWTKLGKTGKGEKTLSSTKQSIPNLSLALSKAQGLVRWGKITWPAQSKAYRVHCAEQGLQIHSFLLALSKA